MTDFELPARVQLQLWVNDNAMDTGPSIEFDASSAMLNLRASQFRSVAEEILMDRGHDYDDLALNAGIAEVDEFLAKNAEGTILATVEAHDFAEWLEKLGLTENEGLSMTDDLLETVRGRVAEEIAEQTDEVAAPSGGM